MAQPLSAAAVLTALKAEGVRVVEVGNWRTHNRAGRGAWGPVNGTMVHHTVTSGTASTVALVRDGRSDLPGPLCHGMIAKDGRVHLVGWGRANHAGGGDPNVLAAVIAENYGTRPPAPHQHEGSAGAVDGNARFYGWECENLGDGHDPWPAAQYDAIVRVQAALCRAHGWTAKSVIGHLEWSDWKPDPKGFTMPDLRADVAERLLREPSWTPDTTNPPTEDDMPLSDADVKKVADALEKRLFDTDGVYDAPTDALDYNPDETSPGHYWSGRTWHRDVLQRTRNLTKAVDEIDDKVSALTATGLTDEQIAAIATAVATSPALVNALAEALANRLAARVQP